MELKRSAQAGVLLAALAAIGTACSGSSGEGPEATAALDVIVQSLANFREVESFQTTFNTKTQADEFELATTGEGGVAAGDLVYARMTIEAGGDEQQFQEVLFAAPDLYMKQADGQWFVLSPWNQGQRPGELSDFSPDELVIDYRELAGKVTGVAERPEESIDGEAFLHYTGRLDLQSLHPDVPEGVSGHAEADFFLSKMDYLPRRVRLITEFDFGGETVVEDETYDFREYGRPLKIPERPAQVSPWRDLEFPEAPCTGKAFEQCLSRQSEIEPRGDAACKGSGRRVCLLPLGQVSPGLIAHLVEHYESQYGLDVSVMMPQGVPTDMADPLRQQIDVIELLDYMFVTFPEAHLDPDAVIIGVTPLDLYDKRSHFRYLFGIKNDFDNPKAVVSSMRMSPEFYREPASDELVFSRMRKLVSKYVGLLYYGLPPSEDPTSPMFDSILGPDDLDAMMEPLPVQ